MRFLVTSLVTPLPNFRWLLASFFLPWGSVLISRDFACGICSDGSLGLRCNSKDTEKVLKSLQLKGVTGKVSSRLFPEIVAFHIPPECKSIEPGNLRTQVAEWNELEKEDIVSLNLNKTGNTAFLKIQP